MKNKTNTALLVGLVGGTFFYIWQLTAMGTNALALRELEQERIAHAETLAGMQSGIAEQQTIATMTMRIREMDFVASTGVEYITTDDLAQHVVLR